MNLETFKYKTLYLIMDLFFFWNKYMKVLVIYIIKYLLFKLDIELIFEIKLLLNIIFKINIIFDFSDSIIDD